MTEDDILDLWMEIVANKQEHLVEIESSFPYVVIMFSDNIHSPKKYESYISHLLRRSCQFYLVYKIFLKNNIDKLTFIFTNHNGTPYTFRKLIKKYEQLYMKMDNEKYIELIKKDL